jgi:uncharacterized protein (DUF1499 family)
MKIARIMAACSALLLAGCGSLAAQKLRSADGRLAPCGGPHCVSSVDPDPERRVPPLVYTVSPSVAQKQLVAILKGMERTRVVANQHGYVRAEVESALLGFVDDVELLFGAGNRIDVRSSSRAGYYDFDVNRRRVEQIRAAFDRTQP